MNTFLGILWIVGALGAQSEQPAAPSSPPPETNSASEKPVTLEPEEQSEILSSLLPTCDDFSGQEAPPCFEPHAPPTNHSAHDQSGVPVVHSELLVQVTGRMDTADRRGRAARAEFCNRRIDLSASQPAQEPSAPTPIPGPGSVGVFVSAALALLRRRRE